MASLREITQFVKLLLGSGRMQSLGILGVGKCLFVVLMLKQGQAARKRNYVFFYTASYSNPN